MSIEQPLYWSSPYQKELIATIIDIRDSDVLLNHTVFYPGGGGQPPDEGTLIYDEYEIKIIEAYKDEVGIWHKLDLPKGLELKANKEVVLRLNWDRRYKLMKAHTAQHLVSHFMKKLFGYNTLKANFWPGEIEIELSDFPKEEEIIKVLIEANKKIIEGIEVKSIVVNQETFQKEYRDKVRGKISKEPIVRLIQLGDFDLVCCGGVHIKNLSEIKGIFFETSRKSICKFLVDENGIMFANEQRMLMHKLERLTTKKGEKLLEFTENKMTQAEEMLLTAGQLLRLLFKNFTTFSEKIAQYNVAFFEFPHIERQLLHSCIKELEGKGLIVIFGKNNIFYFISTEKDIPANEIVKTFIEEIGGRGGGNPKFAQVSVPKIDKPIKQAREIIEKLIKSRN